MAGKNSVSLVKDQTSVEADDIAENQRAANYMRKFKSDPRYMLTEEDLFGKEAARKRPLIETLGSNLDYLSPEEQADIRLAQRAAQHRQAGTAPRQRQVLTETMPAADDDMLMEDTAPVNNGWKIKRFIGETKSGRTVPVWKVVNETTGMSMDKLFKVEEVAIKLVTILNHTGNVNDPRVLGVLHLYEKRNGLLKEIRSLQGSTGDIKKGRLQDLRSQLATIDYKLGI